MSDDENFTDCIRKPPKRFYIGGFASNVNKEKIIRYVNKCGPTVTWKRVWSNKRNPNNAVICLNVVDNYKCLVLMAKNFGRMVLFVGRGKTRHQAFDKQ